MKHSLVVISLNVFAALAMTVSTVLAATVPVSPANMDGWAFQTDGTATAQFENGPGTPPLGSGSVELAVGSLGDSGAEIRNTAYAGTALSSLTALSYSTFVSTDGSGGQAAYLILNVDTDNDGLTDDLLFFEPVYQTGAYSGDPVPNQGAPTVNTWQTWDALAGGWWSLNASTYGPPLVTLATYIAAHPNATIVNSETGSGGVRIVAGYGTGAWDNFVGNADAFTIGVAGSDTTYDFEYLVLVGPPTSKDQCKNGGWQAFNTPRAFKNEGDCIQFVNTGK